MRGRLQEPSFWTALQPDLSLSTHVQTAPRAAPLASGAAALASLTRHGYADLGVVLPLDVVARLSDAIRVLQREGLPPVFALVYDEPWQALASIRGALPAPLDDVEMLADGWVWAVAPAARGWPAHRDHNELVRPEGGAPERFTAWIALTDLRDDSSTVAVVGRERDPAYPQTLQELPTSVPPTYEARGPAGSAFLWDANALHWGTAHAGSTPRLSISTTFCTARLCPPAAIAITRERQFGLAHRLDAIAYSLLRYRRYEPLDPDLERWARDWCAFGRIARGLERPETS